MTDQRGSPWWASGAEGLDDVADPLAAHRAARTSEPRTGAPGAGEPVDDDRTRPWDVPWEDWDDRDPPPPDGARRSAVDDAVDAAQAFARFVAARSGRGRSGLRPHGRDQVCRACPWCIALRSLGDARPEVVEHLDEALRHLVAAARAWVDAAEDRGQWERIPLDPIDDDDDTPEPDHA